MVIEDETRGNERAKENIPQANATRTQGSELNKKRKSPAGLREEVEAPRQVINY